MENETEKAIKTLALIVEENFTQKHLIFFVMSKELIAAYTPQQNYVLERKNRTILNMVRSLLPRRKIPTSFWLEAVNWIIHLLSRSPTFFLFKT